VRSSIVTHCRQHQTNESEGKEKPNMIGDPLVVHAVSEQCESKRGFKKSPSCKTDSRKRAPVLALFPVEPTPQLRISNAKERPRRDESNDPREKQTCVVRQNCVARLRRWHTPNENKMSDAGRPRSSLGVEVWKSSQKVERTAVRRSLHRMVEAVEKIGGHGIFWWQRGGVICYALSCPDSSLMITGRV
jgi:hypothetical protein